MRSDMVFLKLPKLIAVPCRQWMGVQIEMGCFLLVLLSGFRQIHQVTEAQGQLPTKFKKDQPKSWPNARGIFERNSLAWLHTFQVTKLRVNDSCDVVAIDTFLLKMPL
jgi:hypothetical protein